MLRMPMQHTFEYPFRFGHALSRFSFEVVPVPSHRKQQSFRIQSLRIRIVGVAVREIPHSTHVPPSVSIVGTPRTSRMEPRTIHLTDAGHPQPGLDGVARFL